jgi:hypothetical protein
MKKIVLLQEASIRALKMSGGRFEAALEFLQKQQQQQNEPVNGMSKGASSGKLVNLLLHGPMCKLEQNPLKKLMFSHFLKKLPSFMEQNAHCCVHKSWSLCLKQFRYLHLSQ